MNTMIKNKKGIFVITFAFILAVIFGNYAIINVSVLGIVPTYYRVLIPAMFIIFLIFNSKENDLNKKIIQDRKSCLTGFFFVMIVWILYGTLSLLLSPWSVFSDGAKEILCLGLGCCSVYVIVSLCKLKQFDTIILAVKVTVIINLIIGFIEIFSGEHLPTSQLNDETYLLNLIKLYGWEEISESMFHVATGIFYNQNDYCAFLSIFSIIFLYDSGDKTGSRIVNYIIFAIINCMLVIDNAFICVIAFFIGSFFYLLISRASIKKWAISVGIILVIRALSEKIMELVYFIIFGPAGAGEKPIIVAKPEDMVAIQMENMAQETGSMYMRINTYIEGVSEMFVQSKGMGLGAGSFTNYFKDIAEDRAMMLNPHALWIEIFSQYGLIVFLLFAGVLIYIFAKLFIINRKKRCSACALVMAMGVAFIIASCAPSSFMKTTYYWIPIGLALGLLNNSKVDIDGNEEESSQRNYYENK